MDHKGFGRIVQITQKTAVKLAASHLVTSCATLAAILLFVGLGSQLLPSAFAGMPLPEAGGSLKMAFLLNIAIILFGWRRSKDLREALDAYDKAERLAHRNANTDHATGLANRRELMRSLSEVLEARSGGVLLLVDLDHFKRVNDLHGHLVGDQLLKVVGVTLQECAPEGSCCARIGGDEFAILLDGSSEAVAEALANMLVERLSVPLRIGNIEAHVSASVGLAVIGQAADEETVLRQSDVALYAAKRAGRNCFAWFDRDLERELTERLKLEEDIRNGVEHGEFVPFFQPLIDLASGDMVGFETLARWRSSTRGLLEPDAFLEIAESTGLIAPLTISVMEQALSEARDWPGNLKIAVNISPVQFRDPKLAEQVLKVLAKTGFPANRLELEITEGSLLEDRDQVMTIIESLKNVGISISLDDFGTGYASLAQLHNFPVDRIKIDRSFISTLVKSDRTAAIVNTIASLGHKLNVPITAEGVESEHVRGELGKLGCSQAQGWLFGRAVSADSVTAFLKMNGSTSHQAPTETRPAPTPERRRGSAA